MAERLARQVADEWLPALDSQPERLALLYCAVQALDHDDPSRDIQRHTYLGGHRSIARILFRLGDELTPKPGQVESAGQVMRRLVKRGALVKSRAGTQGHNARYRIVPSPLEAQPVERKR